MLLLVDAVASLVVALLLGFAVGAASVRPVWRLALLALLIEHAVIAYAAVDAYRAQVEADERQLLLLLALISVGAGVTLALARTRARADVDPSDPTRRLG